MPLCLQNSSLQISGNQNGTEWLHDQAVPSHMPAMTSGVLIPYKFCFFSQVKYSPQEHNFISAVLPTSTSFYTSGVLPKGRSFTAALECSP